MHIKLIVRVSAQGISRPYQCLDEHGVLRWCKGSHTGLKAVMSEWMCAKMAHALGLPVPPCDILYLDPNCFAKWQKNAGNDLPTLVTESNPFVFASTNVEDAKDVTDPLDELKDEDPALLARIFTFDAFIRNTDRTDYNSNLLINGGVHIIDHNNAFDPDFDSNAFSQTHILRECHANADPRAKAAFEEQLRETITAEFLAKAWSEMPEAWTDAASEVFSLESVLHLLKLEPK